MAWRVLITAQPMVLSGGVALERLRGAGHELVVCDPSQSTDRQQWVPLLRDADAVIAATESYDAALLGSPEAKRLKLISRWGVGYDAVDVVAATQEGIVVAYTPGLLDEAVADYAFSLLCSLARCVHTGHAELSAGRWTPRWGRSIHGKTLGLVGCGRIGLAMARRAVGFGMKLLAHDPFPSTKAIEAGVEFTNLNDLLIRADFVSLHAAVTPATRGMIGIEQLGLMRPEAYLINTARGALVDERALAETLARGGIAGAALDAFQVEPLPSNHPFIGLPNLLLTPHQASFAHETGAEVSAAAADAVLAAASGERPRWVVNEAVLQSPTLRLRRAGA